MVRWWCIIDKQELLKNLNEEERKVVLDILKQYGEKGSSELLEKIKYKDYKEIPVDIETFINNDNYLGKAWKDKEGNTKLYPFWLNVLKTIFPTNVSTVYDTLLESGARGLGKSEIACGIIAPYLMYRIFCLKNPLEFFHLKNNEKIVFAFMNIKLELTEAIAIDKFQKTIQMSPWFMSMGKMTSYNNQPYWIPPEPVEIIIGSQADDVIGLPVYFCLDEDTIVNTIDGDFKIKDLENKKIRVNNIDSEGNMCVSEECTVKVTGEFQDEYEIELEDGSIIKCTPNHRFMLKNGSYKEAKDLTEKDELFDVNITYDNYIQTIIATRGQWNIPDGEYFEAHHIVPICLGGEGTARKGRARSHHPNIIWLYAHEHFIAHKLLALENPTNKHLTSAWMMMAFPKGKTKREYELTPYEYELVRKLYSEAIKGSHLSEETKNKLRNINLGKSLDLDTRLKISKGNKGKVISKETRDKISIAQKQLDRTNRTPSLIGKKCITNGKDIKYISKDEIIPKDWWYGNCKTAQKHNMSRYYASEESQKRMSESRKGVNNSMYGKGYKLQGGNNGKAIYIYTYKEIDYQCRKDLMIVLKKEYPLITENVIRKIVNNTYTKRINNKFQEVIDNLSWRLKK